MRACVAYGGARADGAGQSTGARWPDRAMPRLGVPRRSQPKVAGPGSQLAGALEVATDQARQISTDATHGEVTHADGRLSATRELDRRDLRPVHQNAGEGIGLSIVKRLCELLDATLDVQSTIDVGTTFRILLPRRYADGS